MLNIITIITVILTLILLEVGWTEHDEDAGIIGAYQAVTMTQPIKFTISILTIITCLLLYFYYQELVYFDSLQFKISQQQSNLSIWTSDRKKYFLLEVFICSLHVPPYSNKLQFDFGSGLTPIFYDKFSAITLFRLYMLCRLYRDYSKVYKWRQWILEIGDFRKNSAQVKFGASLSFKDLFNFDPWYFVITLTVISLLFFAYGIYVAERKEQPDIFSFASNCIYFTAVTMTTTGYGDYSPLTEYGRFISMLIAIVGISLASLLVAAMMNTIDFTPNERIASQMVATRRTEEAIKDTASSLIANFYALKQYKQHKVILSSFQKKMIAKKIKIDQSDQVIMFYKMRIMKYARQFFRQKIKLHNILASDDRFLLAATLSDLNLNIADMTKQLQHITDTLSDGIDKVKSSNSTYNQPLLSANGTKNLNQNNLSSMTKNKQTSSILNISRNIDQHDLDISTANFLPSQVNHNQDTDDDEYEKFTHDHELALDF